MKSAFTKITVTLFTATALATSAFAFGGGDHDSERGSKGMMAKMCSPEAQEKMEQRKAAVDKIVSQTMNLSAEQQGLYDALKQQMGKMEQLKQQGCDKAQAAQGQGNGQQQSKSDMRAQMKEMRQQGKAIMDDMRTKMKDFTASLNQEQAALWSMISKGMKDVGERTGKGFDKGHDHDDQHERGQGNGY